MRARSGTRLACLFLAIPLALALSCSSARSGESIGSSSQAELVDTFGLGGGRSGALDATAAGTVVNTYAPVTAVTSTTVTVGPTQGAAAPFGPGDLVIVWRTTGLAAVTTSQAPFNLTADVGGYEFGRIKTVAGAVLTFTNPLGSMSRYTTGSQVVRVPEYTSASIGPSASVVPYAWDGSSGGIVIFLATGTVTNAGSIAATGAGFRGGLLENATTAAPAPHCTAHDGSDESASCGGAHKGEGLDPAAYSLPSVPSGMQPTSTYGNGNYANGAGGGEARNAGGGGGGSLGEGGSGGATSSTDGTRAVGGYGGAPVAYSGNSGFVSLGGGGGAGDEDHGSGTAGGTGGGVVLLRAAAFAGAGAFHADGASVTAAATSDGAGGGGGAGAVLLFSAGSLACTSVSANGGSGGVGGSEPDGPGGGGGGGLVYVEASSTTGCTFSVAPGAGGTTGGILDGATTGQVGQISSQGLAFGQGSCTPQVLGNNQCGGCVTDADCGGEVCDSATNRCGPCNATEQGTCTGTTSACSNDTCVACTGDFGGGGTSPCLSAAAPRCVLTGAGAGTCGTCVSASDCTALTPSCSSQSFTCVACNRDPGTTATAPCPSGASPYCQAAGTCGTCTMDSDCTTGTHAGPRCDVVTGACGNTCATDAVCGSGQWCDDLMTMPGVCQAETANGQTVPGGNCTPQIGARACVTGVCSATDNECGLPNGASCEGDAGVHDPACRSGVCEQSGPSIGTCEGCASDSDCTGTTPACSSTGACVECTAKSSLACTGDTPLCSLATSACVACNGDLGTKATLACTQSNAPFCSSSGACGNCTANSDCTGPGHAGPICSASNGSCSAACRSSSDCGTDEWCNSDDAGFGSCMPKIANGGPLPTTPSTYSTCTAAVGMLVCASGVCNPDDNRCGAARGDAGSDAATSFDAGVPIGVSLEGGALSCTARSGPTSSGSGWLFGLAIGLASIARRRR